MDRTRTELADRALVLRCTVTLVLREAVPGIFFFHVPHQSIAKSLGDNRRRRNGEIEAVAFVESVLRNRHIRDHTGVDQQMFRLYGKSFHGSAHGEKPGTINVETIDFTHLRRANTNARGGLPDLAGQMVALLGIELLGVIDAEYLRARWKHHGCRNHRTGQRPHADFVDAGDRADAGLPQQSLEVEHILYPQPLSPFLLVALFEQLVQFANALARIALEPAQKLRRHGIIAIRALPPDF